MPNSFYNIRFSHFDLLQVTQGLEVRAAQWERTASYMETGETCGDFFIPEECSCPDEARQLEQHYRRILMSMEHQVAKQGGW